MILSGQFASKQEVLRFRSEAEAAANLRHPNIVAIYETGESDGQHYFSMELVEGRSLAEIGRDGPLPAQRAAGYAKVIAEAIHYAHQQGTMHRDLKPSNVLIDANDQPRVTDFGLAKRARGDFSLTGSGQMLGSPNYMPPEQCGWRSASELPDPPLTPSLSPHPMRGEGGRRPGEGSKQRRLKIGPYSDVYSLGATLYFLLTGRPPFMAEALSDTLHQLLNADPVQPRLLNPSVPLDLQTICLKCLEKEPDKRYPTSQAMADELGRFLNDEPIRARPVSRLERAWRWCRRKPALATLILAVQLVGAMGLAGILWQWRRAETNATNERHEHNVAEGRLYAAQMNLAHAAYKAGKIGGALELLRAQPPDFRGFEWRFLYQLCSSTQSEVLATNANGFSSVDYSPDRRTVAFGTGEGAVEIFDLNTRQRVARWRAHDGVIDDLAFCPQNANWLATASGDDGLLKLWDVARERVLLSTNSSKGIWGNLAFSPSGRFLVSGAPDAQSLNFWELRPMAAEAIPELNLKTNLAFLGPAAFSPDERSMALCNPIPLRFEVASYALASGQVVAFPKAHANLIQSVVFSPDGSKLASGGPDERVVLWDPRNRVPIHTNATELITVTSLTFAPDSQILFASGWDQNIRSWDLRKLGETLTLRGHSAGVNAIAISPDGSSLASGGRDGRARLWKLRMEDPAFMAQPPDEFSTLLRSEDRASPEHGELWVIAAAVSPDQVKAPPGSGAYRLPSTATPSSRAARMAR